MTPSEPTRIRPSFSLAQCLLKIAALLLASATFSPSLIGQTTESETADLLSELIRIDTTNPPGNEDKVAEFLAARLRPLGFDIHIVPTPEPGKAHFIARLKGDGSKRAVLLAAHADVVGVEREKWTIDPFVDADACQSHPHALKGARKAGRL